MNLIEVFESKPFQDVGTFNAIFKDTPILGFPFTEEVRLKELVPGKGRRILVAGQELFIELNAAVKTPPKKERRVSEIARKSRSNRKQYEKRAGFDGKLPRIMKELTPSEFFAFTCIKKMGETTVAEICYELKITNYRTMHHHINALISKGYIKIVGKTSSGRVFSIDADKNKQ